MWQTNRPTNQDSKRCSVSWGEEFCRWFNPITAGPRDKYAGVAAENLDALVRDFFFASAGGDFGADIISSPRSA